jgi:hypothetical protein
MLYTKLNSIAIIKEALEFWGKPEVITELTEEEWLIAPYCLCFDGTDVFITDNIKEEDLEVPYSMLKEPIEVIKYNRRFVGYSAMGQQLYPLVGSSIYIVYKLQGLYFDLDGNSYPPEAFGVSQTGGSKRGDIFELVNPFGDLQILKDAFGIEGQIVATRTSTNEAKLSYQVRGSKTSGTIPMCFIKQVGSKVTFKPKTVQTETCTVNCTEVYNKVNSFYKDNRTEISKNFSNVIATSVASKLNYLPFLFRDGINLNLSKDETFRQKCIRLHPRYSEMIQVLKELGVDTDAQKDNIFNNTIVIEGAKKPKTVTGFIQGQKKLRFDNVYSEAQKVFEAGDQVWISADPYEMVRASEFVNSRSGDLSSSCFRYGSQYHASVWGYIQSKQTTILKIKDAEGRTAHRMWISYDLDNGAIVFGRRYGHLNEYQQKVIRYTLEAKVADFLELPDSWTTFPPDSVEADRDDNTYWDSPSKVMVLRAVTPAAICITLGDGLNSDAESSSTGEFTPGVCCSYCEDRVREADITYIEGYGDICDNCLRNNFTLDIRDNYIHNSHRNWICDIEEYVHDNEISDYIEINSNYYSEMPRGWVDTEDIGVCKEEVCFYDVVAEVWYSDRQSDYMNTVYDEGYVHDDNVDSDLHWCSGCSHYHRASEECPKCGEKVEK